MHGLKPLITRFTVQSTLGLETTVNKENHSNMFKPLQQSSKSHIYIHIYIYLYFLKQQKLTDLAGFCPKKPL